MGRAYGDDEDVLYEVEMCPINRTRKPALVFTPTNNTVTMEEAQALRKAVSALKPRPATLERLVEVLGSQEGLHIGTLLTAGEDTKEMVVDPLIELQTIGAVIAEGGRLREDDREVLARAPWVLLRTVGFDVDDEADVIDFEGCWRAGVLRSMVEGHVQS